MVKKNGAAPFVYPFEDPKAVMGGASFLVLLVLSQQFRRPRHRQCPSFLRYKVFQPGASRSLTFATFLLLIGCGRSVA